MSGHSDNRRRSTGSSGSSIDPAGERAYFGGSVAAISLSTVLRLIPSRRAISRFLIPSACIARTSAQSTALRTSLASSSTTHSTMKADTKPTARDPARWLSFQFLEVAHYWVPGVSGSGVRADRASGDAWSSS